MAAQGQRKPAGNGSQMGRPPGARNLTAEEKRLSKRANGSKHPIDYMKVENRFNKADDFLTYLRGYPDKTGLTCSLYRLEPKIDQTLIGIEEAVIFQTATESEMTEEHIGGTFGRGHYMLILADSNRQGKKEVARTWYDLRLLPKPPVYDVRTLCLNWPKNSDEVTRLLNLGVLVRDRFNGQVRVKTDGDPISNPPPPVASAPNPLGNFDLGHVIATVLTERSRSPHEAVKDTIELANLLKPPTVDVEAIVERVATRLGVGAKGNKDIDALETYTRVGSLLDKLRPPVAEKAKRGGSLAATWGPYIPTIVAELRAFMPELRETWHSITADFYAGRNGHANGTNGGQQVVRQQPQPRQVTMEQRIEEIMRLGFVRMNEGVKGFDFAAFVCGFHPGGLEVYRLLEPNGAAGVISLMAMNPQARTLVNDPEVRPQLESFLDDFFQFDPSGIGRGEETPPADGAGV